MCLFIFGDEENVDIFLDGKASLDELGLRNLAEELFIEGILKEFGLRPCQPTLCALGGINVRSAQTEECQCRSHRAFLPGT